MKINIKKLFCFCIVCMNFPKIESFAMNKKIDTSYFDAFKEYNKQIIMKNSQNILQLYRKTKSTNPDEMKMVGFGYNGIVYMKKDDKDNKIIVKFTRTNAIPNFYIGYIYELPECIFYRESKNDGYGPNVMKIFKDSLHIIDRKSGDSDSFNVWFEMEFIDGYDLFDYVNDKRNICTCEQIINWVLQVISGLKSLHADGWSFGDPNLISNIRLRKKDLSAVIIDFGHTAKINDMKEKYKECKDFVAPLGKIENYDAFSVCKLIIELSKFVSIEDRKKNNDIWKELSDGLLSVDKNLNSIEERLKTILSQMKLRDELIKWISKG